MKEIPGKLKNGGLKKVFKFIRNKKIQVITVEIPPNNDRKCPKTISIKNESSLNIVVFMVGDFSLVIPDNCIVHDSNLYKSMGYDVKFPSIEDLRLMKCENGLDLLLKDRQ